MIAFGPVPSRRLGQSLGINNIPPKVCTCSCVYCQLGRTIRMRTGRRRFERPEGAGGRKFAPIRSDCNFTRRALTCFLRWGAGKSAPMA
jgi:hypothetical protein